MPQSEMGIIEAKQDFTGSHEDTTWGTGTVDLGDGWAMCSVNEGTLNKVTDESNGVLQFLTDTGDNDNVCLFAGPFRPSDGGVTVEARFKVADDLVVGLFCGFTETLAVATPVMPAEFATATMTYNGSGGMLGLQYDDDGTTDDWRAVMGDGGANTGGTASANGVRANATVTANVYDVVRAELNQDGSGAVYLNEVLVKKYAAGLTNTDLFYAVVMCENREAAAKEFEVDYAIARGYRNWATS